MVDVTTIQGVFTPYGNSDLGLADIAKKIGIFEQTLYYYKRKLKNKEVKNIDSIETKWLGREI